MLVIYKTQIRIVADIFMDYFLNLELGSILIWLMFFQFSQLVSAPKDVFSTVLETSTFY